MSDADRRIAVHLGPETVVASVAAAWSRLTRNSARKELRTRLLPKLSNAEYRIVGPADLANGQSTRFKTDLIR